MKGEQQLSQPSNTATDSCPGSLEVNSKNTFGGDVACFLSLLATNKVRKCFDTWKDLSPNHHLLFAS